MYAVYIRISCVKHFNLRTMCMQFYVLDGYLRHGCIVNTIPKEITDKSTLHAIRSSLRCATWLYLYTCSSNSRSNIDHSALLVFTKIHIGSRRPWPVSNSIYQSVCQKVLCFLRTFTGYTNRIKRLRFSCFARLTLKAPTKTKFDCFCRLLKCLRSLSNKQCRLRSDCSYRSSLIWVRTICLYT